MASQSKKILMNFSIRRVTVYKKILKNGTRLEGLKYFIGSKNPNIIFVPV